MHLSPENQRYYLCAGASGAGAGASAGVSAGAGAGASAGLVSSGFGVSAGLQPRVNATNNINDNTKAITFFINFHLLPLILY